MVLSGYHCFDVWRKRSCHQRVEGVRRYATGGAKHDIFTFGPIDVR
jgi:hypothetical protein